MLQPDLIFLDIELGGGSDGFDLIESLERPPIVVFVTAFAEHAVEAFAVNAVDYLLKPVEPVRLEAALARGGAPARASRRCRRGPGVIELRTPRRTLFATPGEIVAVSADGDFTRVFVAGQPAVMILRTLAHFEELLPAPPFVRLGPVGADQPRPAAQPRGADALDRPSRARRHGPSPDDRPRRDGPPARDPGVR